MQAVTITQITPLELESLIEKSVHRAINSRVDNQPAPSPKDDELLTAAQAGVFLGLSIQTIYGKIHRKELPVHKPHGCKRVYFSKKALTEFVSSGRVKTSTEIDVEARELSSGKPSKK